VEKVIAAEEQEKLHLLCLGESRQDRRWACMLLRGWAKDQVKSFIPCFSLRASR
jgi:hypothetical protein